MASQLDPAAVRSDAPSCNSLLDATYGLRIADRGPILVGSGIPQFEIVVPSERYWRNLLRADAYRAGRAFIRGELEIEGDLVAALEIWSRRRPARTLSYLMRSLVPHLRHGRRLHRRPTTRRQIEFHFDRSNDFFRAFLDRRLVYSCAYFQHTGQPLDEAQEAKLDQVCRKLDLHGRESLLDVGCGWGALVAWAADRYGAHAMGCTLSARQHDLAVHMLDEAGLADRARVKLCDLRDVRGRFAKIASVGMAEHVERTRLCAYFAKLASLLEPSGLILNHGVVRPAGRCEDAIAQFLHWRMFPCPELPTLAQLIASAEHAGLEVLDVESLRPHYALTCRAWVGRLQANQEACLAAVDLETYRTWLLYLAGAAAQFARGATDVYQILLAKRSAAQVRHLTRDYMYRREAIGAA